MRSLHPWPLFPHDLGAPEARSLAILFILEEVLATFDAIGSFSEAAGSLASSDGEQLQKIAQRLERLLLFSLEHPLAQRVAHLDKLCYYFERLLECSDREDGGEAPRILEEMRSVILDLRAKIGAARRKSAPKGAINGAIKGRAIVGDLTAGAEALRARCVEFFHALFPFLQESRGDENVLFYLIEQRRCFNKRLGPHAIEELLLTMFPGGMKDLRAVLCEGYTRRGFASFYAEHEPLFDALEADAACLSLPI